MSGIGGYAGCKAIIRNEEDGATVAETVINEYDRRTLTISIDSSCFKGESFERVSLLILKDSSIYEFKGNFRKTNYLGKCEIALHHGHEREGRTANRFTVNTPAVIENLAIANNLIALPSPLNVVVENISTKGMLIAAEFGALKIGGSFQLKLKIGGSDTLIHSTVVRMNYINEKIMEYGCRFNFLY